MLTPYTAYFDASGHPRDPQHTAVAVAGFVSTHKKWSRFDIEWNAILKVEGVAAFHMTEFVSSQGEFSGWKGQTKRRKGFIGKLVACIKRNVNKSFRATIELHAYAEANKTYMLGESIGQPYAICALQCWDAVKQWAKRKHVGDKVPCYFEDGDWHKGNFQQRAREVYDEEPLFLPKGGAVAFQAADFFAWRFRTSLQGLLRSDNTRKEELSYLRSIAELRAIPSNAVVFTKKPMIAYCRREGILIRGEAGVAVGL